MNGPDVADLRLAAILVALAQLAYTAFRYRGASGRASPTLTGRLLESVALLAIGWLLFGVVWGSLAFSMGFPPAMVLEPVFLVLGGFATIGAFSTRQASIGGFMGGGLPLSVLSLFYVSHDPQMQAMAPPLAWFGLFMVFGGLLGAIVGPASLALMRRIGLHASRRRPLRPGSTAQGVEMTWDVFLSHNSRDKPFARDLARELRARGLRIWMDEDDLVPGGSSQQGLESALEHAGTALVLFGPSGFGPWQTKEIRVSVSQWVQRGMPVITVLLPGALGASRLPAFLRELTWVDLREGLTVAGLDRLEWGITGHKPSANRD